MSLWLVDLTQEFGTGGNATLLDSPEQGYVQGSASTETRQVGNNHQ
jgi:hypothetical protein